MSLKLKKILLSSKHVLTIVIYVKHLLDTSIYYKYIFLISSKAVFYRNKVTNPKLMTTQSNKISKISPKIDFKESATTI